MLLKRIVTAFICVTLLTSVFAVPALAGVCPVCGEETVPELVNEYPGVVISNNDGSHEELVEEWTYNYCANCDELFSGVPGESYYETFYCSGSICYHCGYVCPHPLKAQDLRYEFEEDSAVTYAPIPGNSSYHYATGSYSEVLWCNGCETHITEAEISYGTVKSGHFFSDYLSGTSECLLCGYVSSCSHPDDSWQIYYEIRNSTMTPIDEYGHSINGERWQYYGCGECGYHDEYSYYLADGNEDYSEYTAHNFNDRNICTDCGFSKSNSSVGMLPTDIPILAPETAIEPAITPETNIAPVFIELAPREVLNGVSAEDAPELIETMVAITQALTASDDNISVRVLDIDSVLELDTLELLVYEQLPIHEQLLVTLSAIGFEDEVIQSEIELSDEALALIGSIKEHINALDEVALAEYEALLQEFFPIEIIEIDGVEYDYFVIKLEITDGDDIRYEGFGFRYDAENGKWLLTKLYTA